MLHFEPKGWFSKDYRVRAGSRVKTELELGRWREGGGFTFDGVRYSLKRSGWLTGSFFLEADDLPIASADKTNVFARGFQVTCPEGSFVLRPRGFFSRKFDLVRGRSVVGTIAPVTFWSRGGEASLPKSLSFETSVFLVWLVIVMWRRANDGGAGAGAVP